MPSDSKIMRIPMKNTCHLLVIVAFQVLFGLKMGSVAYAYVDDSDESGIVGTQAEKVGSLPQRAETRFTRLGESATGIDFVSPLLPDHKFGYLYHSGMTCSGLAAGDIDGDGRPDLFLANGPGDNALYLQTGDGIHFEDVTDAACAALRGGDNWTAGVAMADVDNDGDLDLYVCNYDVANSLFINLGPGDGKRVRFKEMAEPAGVAVKDASHMAAFSDYDNDGDLDFYLLTNRIENPEGGLAKLPVTFDRPGVPTLMPGFSRHYNLWIVDSENWGVEPAGRPDYLFRNDGVNSQGVVQFTDVSTQAGISGRGDGLTTTWWDADLDGDCDLFVCNDFISEDRFYINNGDGTFTNQIAETVPHTTWFSMGSSFGDLDNDGDFDMLVADMSATSHYKSKVTMGVMGGLTQKRANTSSPPQYMRNALYLNEGTSRKGIPRFREGAFLAGLASSDWTWAIKMNDFDSDGFLDVYMTNGVPAQMNHSDTVITEEMLAGKHMWDFNKDSPMRKEHNVAYRNLGGLKFSNVGEQWGLDHFGASYGAVCADFDLDGDLDMAVMNLEENVAIYRNDGSSGSQLSVKLNGTTSNRFGLGSTVTVEAGGKTWIRQLIPSVGYHSYDEPILHFGLGKVDKIDRMTVTWPGGAKQVVTNVPLNKRIEVTEKPDAETAIGRSLTKRAMFSESDALRDLWHQENEFDDFALQPLLPHRLSTEGPCMAIGDANGDGQLDIFVGGSAGNLAEMRFGTGKGQFEMANGMFLFADAAGEDSDAEFIDFDSDGDLDLLVARGSYEFKADATEQVNLLYINDGTGNFKKADAGLIPQSATNSGTLAVCDFDQDGDSDVFVGTRVRHGKYPLSDASELWVNEGGEFVNATDKLAPELADAALVTGATWADVNLDGNPDLVVAREWGTVAVYQNENGKLALHEETGDLGELSGWWNAIDAGDVDGDGDIDLVVTNLGLNTKYKASVKKPMTVYYGDFDQSGKAHIVEVKQEGNVCYPERGRSCSSNAMPFISKKFGTFHDFGLATLSDIYGDEKLEAARKFDAHTFEHGVFLNDGKGKFTFTALPKIAQIAPSHAMKLADLDLDGDLDLSMGQNFFGPQSETGRYDGGASQIFDNDGAGNFLPLSPSQSGVFVREAAMAIEVADVNADGKPDILMATSNGPVKLFVNQENDQ